jgi:hypothetical protein
LGSYDIAALVWHFNDAALTIPYYLELSLVAVTQLQLQELISNPTLAMSLNVPDQSRKIIDSQEKFVALKRLKAEVDELAVDIVRELKPLYAGSPQLVQKGLLEAQIY